jgi:hypothetical protein
MNCEACRSLLSGFLDGALAGDQADQVARHLATCAGCQEELAGLERADRAVAVLEAPAPPRGYLVELQARVRERVGERVAERDEDAESEFEDAARASESSSGGGRARWWRFAPLAAAALVAVAVLKIAELSRPRVDLARRDQVRSPEVASPEVRSPSLLPPDPTATAPADQPAPALHDAANAPSEEVNPSPAGRGLSASAARPPEREMNSSVDPEAGRNAAKDKEVAAPSAAPGTAPAQSMETVETNKEETPKSREAQRALSSETALQAKNSGSAAAMKAGEGSRRTAGVASEPLAIRGDLDGRAEQEAAEVDSPALGRAEHLIAVGNLPAGRKVLDSLMNGAPPVAIAARARFLRLVAEEAEIESGSQADATTSWSSSERARVRSFAARYAQLADELPATAAGRDAAARAARLALEVSADTGDPGDCSFARARIAAFANRYPQDARADSLTAAGAGLPCSR